MFDFIESIGFRLASLSVFTGRAAFGERSHLRTVAALPSPSFSLRRRPDLAQAGPYQSVRCRGYCGHLADGAMIGGDGVTIIPTTTIFIKDNYHE
ncbi:MAG: hypothetical protein EA402_02425 [Planctomycetota bacterium]|nr:MAG: hypothetical protein EA402_02425 [Planctomycetota bacterium]